LDAASFCQSASNFDTHELVLFTGFGGFSGAGLVVVGSSMGCSRNPVGQRAFASSSSSNDTVSGTHRILVLEKFEADQADQVPRPPAPEPGIPPVEIPPLPPQPDIPVPDPASPPIENPGDMPLPPITDPDVVEPGEPNPAHRPMRVRGAKRDWKDSRRVPTLPKTMRNEGNEVAGGGTDRQVRRCKTHRSRIRSTFISRTEFQAQTRKQIGFRRQKNRST
jgi:hypothetical protein